MQQFKRELLPGGSESFSQVDKASSKSISEKDQAGGFQAESRVSRKDLLELGRKTKPTPEMRNYAKRKALGAGFTPERSPTRNQTIALAKIFLADQKREFGGLGLSAAREKLKQATPLDRESEQKVQGEARESDESPYQKRVEVWQQLKAPSLKQKISAQRALAEVERLEAVEAMNLHQRTAAEIFEGKTRTSEKSEKIFVGCDDPALLLLSELRSAGVASSHVQCVNQEWVDELRVLPTDKQEKELARTYHGHVLVKVYPGDEEPVWVDPMGGAIKLNAHWERYNADSDTWEKAEHKIGPYYLLNEGVDSEGSEPFSAVAREKVRGIVQIPRKLEILSFD